MRARCAKPTHPYYANYGGRGIKVCERWSSFENFLSDMGQPGRGLSLDRIDPDGDYEPGNCRWATQREQMNNTRVNRRFTSSDGRCHTMTEWARLTGIPEVTMRWRLCIKGWPVDKAVTTPVRPKRPNGSAARHSAP